MENLSENQNNKNLSICNEEIKGYLLEIAKWGKFLAFLGYVGIGILLLFALVSTVTSFSLSNTLYDSAIPTALLISIYVVIGILYYFPVTYLYRFSIKIKEGLDTEESSTINSGFKDLKSLFKFMAIFSIVIVSLYAIIIVAAAIVALVSGV